jgi:hypothetical protein
MNIWKLKDSIWVNKMNFCNKIEKGSIFQKCKFWYGWTNWTFVTDEYLKIESFDMGEQIELFNKIEIWSIFQKCKFWYGWTNWTFVTYEYLKIERFNVGEQIEIL